ncbi:MAG TPA: PEP-CTERM sorting domain-containing protein [Leptolyngbyaceae cyanobacterium]
MKNLALATAVTLGLVAFAAPAEAASLAWDIEYSGWWEEDGGGFISGQIIADEEDALDGIISIDEMTSWTWSWSGNDAVSAFSISSGDVGASTSFFPSFYVDGTPNSPLPLSSDNLDQGSFISSSGDEVLDLEALLVISYAGGVEALSAGDPNSGLGKVTVSAPTAVPEPAALLGLLSLAAGSTATLKRQKQEA